METNHDLLPVAQAQLSKQVPPLLTQTSQLSVLSLADSVSTVNIHAESSTATALQDPEQLLQDPVETFAVDRRDTSATLVDLPLLAHQVLPSEDETLTEAAQLQLQESSLAAAVTPFQGVQRSFPPRLSLEQELSYRAAYRYVETMVHQVLAMESLTANEDSTSESKEDVAELDDGSKDPFSPRRGETVRDFYVRIKSDLPKSKLSDFLGRPGEFWFEYRRLYMETFNFKRLPLDYAIRLLGRAAKLPREAQQIDRLIFAFAERYHACNPQVFGSTDTVYIITFSVFMLNTNLHNRNIAKQHKMTKDQFLRQLGCTGELCAGVSRNVLEGIFESVMRIPIYGGENESNHSHSHASNGDNFNERKEKASGTVTYDLEYQVPAEGIHEHQFAFEVDQAMNERLLYLSLGDLEANRVLEAAREQRQIAKDRVFAERFAHPKWKQHFRKLGIHLASASVEGNGKFGNDETATGAADAMADMKSLRNKPATLGGTSTMPGGGCKDSLLAASIMIRASLRSSQSRHSFGNQPQPFIMRPSSAQSGNLPPLMKPNANNPNLPPKAPMPGPRVPNACSSGQRERSRTGSAMAIRRSMSLSGNVGLQKVAIGLEQELILEKSGDLPINARLPPPLPRPGSAGANSGNQRSPNVKHSAARFTSTSPYIPEDYEFDKICPTGISTKSSTGAPTLDSMDLKRLMDNKHSPLGSCATLLGTLFAMMQKNPTIERRLCQNGSSLHAYVNTHVCVSTTNQHPLVEPQPTVDMIDLVFRKETGIASKFFGDVVLLHHGPLLRKNLFVDKSFHQPLLRNWKERWYCLVANSRPSKSSSIGHCELWVYAKEDLEGLHRWLDRAHTRWVLQQNMRLSPSGPHTLGKNAKLLKLKRKTATSGAYSILSTASTVKPSAMNIFRGNKNEEEEETDGYVAASKTDHASPVDILTAIHDTLPFPAKRITVQNVVAFVDTTYEKYTDSFQVAWTASSSQGKASAGTKETEKGKQALFLAGDVHREEIQLDRSVPSLEQPDFFVRQLMDGIQLQQNVELSGYGMDGPAVSQPVSDRQNWMFHLNAAAAITTAISEIHAFLHKPEIGGKWTSMKEHLLSLVQLSLKRMQEEIQRKQKERQEESKRRNQGSAARETGFGCTSEESMVLATQIFTWMAWSDILVCMQRIEMDPLLCNVVQDLCKVEQAAYYELQSNATDGSGATSLSQWTLFRIFSILLKLQLYAWKEQKAAYSRQIEVETQKINQLELGAISARYTKHYMGTSGEFGSEEIGGDETTPLNGVCMEDEMRLPGGFEEVVLDPGASIRRGMSMRMQKKQYASRPSVHSIFQPPLDMPAIREDQDDEGCESVHSSKAFPDPTLNAASKSSLRSSSHYGNHKTSTIQKESLYRPGTGGSGTWKQWMAPILWNRSAHNIQKEIVEVEKCLEWKRVEHEKFRVYCAVLGRVIMGWDAALWNLTETKEEEEEETGRCDGDTESEDSSL